MWGGCLATDSSQRLVAPRDDATARAGSPSRLPLPLATWKTEAGFDQWAVPLTKAGPRYPGAAPAGSRCPRPRAGRRARRSRGVAGWSWCGGAGASGGPAGGGGGRDTRGASASSASGRPCGTRGPSHRPPQTLCHGASRGSGRSSHPGDGHGRVWRTRVGQGREERSQKAAMSTREKHPASVVVLAPAEGARARGPARSPGGLCGRGG